MATDIVNATALKNALRVLTIQETQATQSSVNTWVTLANITGKGWIYVVRLSCNASSSSPQFRITIDGTATTFAPTACSPYMSVYTPPVVVLPMLNVRFDSSAKIEFLQTNVNGGAGYSGTANLVWGSR